MVQVIAVAGAYLNLAISCPMPFLQTMYDCAFSSPNAFIIHLKFLHTSQATAQYVWHISQLVVSFSVLLFLNYTVVVTWLCVLYARIRRRIVLTSRKVDGKWLLYAIMSLAFIGPAHFFLTNTLHSSLSLPFPPTPMYSFSSFFPPTPNAHIQNHL